MRQTTSEIGLPRLATQRLASSLNAEFPRVLLVHGTMDRASSFKRVARDLDDFNVISYDRRGYGSSPFNDESGRARKLTWQIHLTDLTEIIADAPTIAFGHSYGGTLCLLAAEQGADNLVGVVSYEAPLPWVQKWARRPLYRFMDDDPIDPGWAAEEANTFMNEMIGTNCFARLPPSTRSKRRHEGTTMISEMSSMALLNPPLDPSAIRVPTIISRASSASQRHIESAQYLHQTIKASALEVIADTGHGVHLENPKAIANVIRIFAHQLSKV